MTAYNTMTRMPAYAQRTIAQLEPYEVDYLNNFAEIASGRASVMASAILCYFYERCRVHPPSIPEGFEQRKRPVTNSIIPSGNRLETYPNPANTYTTISWDLQNIQNGTILRIKDISARTILTQEIKSNVGSWLWDTRKVMNGFYMLEILDNNNVIITDKVIIQK